MQEPIADRIDRRLGLDGCGSFDDVGEHRSLAPTPTPGVRTTRGTRSHAVRRAASHDVPEGGYAVLPAVLGRVERLVGRA